MKRGIRSIALALLIAGVILPSVTNEAAAQYVVKPGDTLHSIAVQHGTTAQHLMDSNNISNPYNLQAGTRLAITGPRTHVVRRGDTLFLLARAYGVSLDAMVAANPHVNPQNLPVGSTLTVPSQGGVTHVVQRGDTLYLLAQRYGTTVQAITQANGLRSTVLQPGMALTIPGGGALPASTPSTGGAQALPWSQVDRLFPRNTTARVTDVWTGLTFTTWRRGGWAHADVEPLTASDTAILRRIYGGSWSWARRPVVVEVGGQRIAASMNGMPHGGQGITSNGFPGHHCIHFLNSTTHGSQRVDPAHQSAIRQATGK